LTKYVRGLKSEIIIAQPGSLSGGINTPLTNTTGNFTSSASIITSEGVSVGRADRSIPIEEKQKLPKIRPKRNGSGSTKLRFKIKAIIAIGIPERVIPIVMEARISPNNISNTVNGIETNLSKVLVRVSMGAITGLIEVAVNQIAIPPSPAIRESGGSSLPIRNEKKKKKGSSIPNITTGPLP